MNNKAMALLAVVVMIASGAVAFVSMPSEVEATGDGSEDSPYDLGTVYVDGSADSTLSAPVVDVKYNQSAYAGLPHKVTLSATVTPTEGDASTATIFVMTKGSEASTTSGTAGGLSFTTENDTTGIIGVTVKSTDTATNSSYTVEFKLNVTINPDMSDSSSLELEPVYYELQVNVRTAGTMVMAADGVHKVAFTVNNDSEQKYKVTIGEEAIADYTAYEWYAYGLPTGLSIYAKEGGVYIGGMPTVAHQNYSVTVMAREISTGFEYTASTSFDVSDAEDFTITLKRGGVILDPTAENEYYVLISDSETTDEDSKPITLEVVSDGKPIVSAIDYDDGLSRVELPTTSHTTPYTYTIPTDGAGVYYVEVSSGAGVEILKINVAINPTGAPGAGFEIISTSSSP